MLHALLQEEDTESLKLSQGVDSTTDSDPQRLSLHQDRTRLPNFVIRQGRTANAPPLNFENGELKGEITPEILGDLPLIVGGALRSATSFVVLLPGVSTPGGNPMDTRINGGEEFGDEAVLDGVSMQDGANGETGMQETLSDHPWSPEAVSEVSVLTSNFEPQYGSTTTSIVTAVTKAGTNKFHGTFYEFLRNTDLNAWQYGVPRAPEGSRE